jgi:hypothetical protein
MGRETVWGYYYYCFFFTGIVDWVLLYPEKRILFLVVVGGEYL